MASSSKLLSPIGNSQLFDNAGNPLAGGTITVYKAGTLTLATIYANAGGGALANPITLNAAGRIANGQLFLDSGVSYDLEIKSWTTVLESYEGVVGLPDINTSLVGATLVDEFVGDGIKSTFTLSADPVDINNLTVIVDGLILRKSLDYTLTDKLLSFVSVPASGVQIVVKQPRTFASEVPASALRNKLVDTFTTTTGVLPYTLSKAPGSVYNTTVSLNGLVLTPGVDYTLLGAVLTLTADPGVKDLVVQYNDTMAVASDSTDSITYPTTGQYLTTYLNNNRVINVKDFGAVGDGVTDDSPSIQAAVNSGLSVFFPDGVFLLKSMITISSRRQHLFGNATIKFASDFNSSVNGLVAFTVSAADVKFSGLEFDASVSVHSTYRDIFINIAYPNCTILNCRFKDLATGSSTGSQAAISANGLGVNLQVLGCYFNNCPGCVFTQGRNCIISNNVMVNSTDAAIALNGANCVACVVTGNTINNEVGAQIPSMIAVEESASEWIISDNVLRGVSGGGIFATNVAVFTTVFGGKIDNNIVDGSSGAVTSPGALVYVSQYYSNTTITNNTLRNCPTGNSSTRMLIASATGTLVENNLIDGSNASGLSALVEIRQGSGGIVFKDNIITGYTGARLVLLQVGTYTGLPVHFVGGKYLVGSIGIDAELNIASITGLTLYIENILQSSMTSAIVSAVTQLGARATWLNAGAWARPHSIKVFTDMWGSPSPPTAPAAGNQPWQAGDRISYLAPVFPGYTGAQLVASTWRSFGALA